MDSMRMITEAQHEKEMTRMETANRRWFVAFMVVLVMLFVSNLAWVIYESQFQDVVVTNTAESDYGGTATTLGTGMGDLYYGEGEQHD